jgi:hypothetical protein
MSRVTNRTVTSRSRHSPRTRSSGPARVRASTAASGSSISSTSGSYAGARAIATRCCIPPDSCHGQAPAASAGPTAASASATRPVGGKWASPTGPSRGTASPGPRKTASPAPLPSRCGAGRAAPRERSGRATSPARPRDFRRRRIHWFPANTVMCGMVVSPSCPTSYHHHHDEIAHTRQYHFRDSPNSMDRRLPSSAFGRPVRRPGERRERAGCVDHLPGRRRRSLRRSIAGKHRTSRKRASIDAVSSHIACEHDHFT